MAIVKLNLSGHENAELAKLSFIFPGALHVDLSDQDLFEKVTEFLAAHVSSEDQVIVALPGLSPLGAIVLTVIHGLSGTFPTIQPLVRGEAGFVPGPVVELQTKRNEIARKARKNLVEL